MNRERQMLQDINQEYDRIIKFSTTDEVSTLDFRNVTHEVKVPARIEGRYRQQTIVTKRLAQVATYASLPELLADKKRDSHKVGDVSWKMDDMPEDVLARYDTWSHPDGIPSEADIREELHSVAGVSVNRMTATRACPDCSSESRYACRLSGWARELYRYPLIQVEDTLASRIYEVPLDVALYVDLHPGGLQYGPKPKFSGDGFMSANYRASLAGETVSGEYVRRVMNGAVEPQSNQLRIVPGQGGMADITVYMGGWQENNINTYMKPFTAEQVATHLQDAAMKRHAERVSEVDYNQLLIMLRQELGRRGLALAFRYKYMGMGESGAEFSVLDDVNQVRVAVQSIDAYEALTELKEKLKIN